MAIIKLGGPQNVFHLKWWASKLLTLRTTEIDDKRAVFDQRIKIYKFEIHISKLGYRKYVK